MKKYLRKVAKFIIIFLCLSIILFFSVIHPNDKRIDFHRPQPSGNSKEKISYGSVFSLWQRNLDLSLRVPLGNLEDLIKNVDRKWPSTIAWKLSRFKYDFQAYVTVGRYPQFLEGRDAVFIPPNSTLILKNSLINRSILEFGAAFGDSTGKILVKNDLDQILIRINGKVSFFEKVAKFASFWLFPSLLRDHSKWFDTKMEVSGVKEIVFECKETDIGCFISNISLKEETKKNLKQTLLILVDTMRFDAIQARIAPKITQFINASVFYESAVSPGNMTSPSTNALLACTPPTFLGSWAFSYGVSDDQRSYFEKRAQKSFPRIIADAGIQTAMIGNISVVSEVMGVGQNHGFQEQISLEFDGYDTPLITEEAMNWLNRNSNRDFFLYVHFNAPHAPHRPPLRDILKVWPGFHIFTSYVFLLDTLYEAEVSYIDRYFGELISYLKEIDLYDNVDIFLTSDHGDQMRPRNFSGNEWGPSFVGTYHDHGATLLNDEVRVPLVHKPSGAQRAKKITPFVSTLQIGPTIMKKFLDAPTGNCYLPELPESDSDINQGKNVLPIEGFRERAIIFEGRYKYIRAYEATVKKVHPPTGYFAKMRPYYVKERLYDLKIDPLESDDIKQKQTKVTQLARKVYRKAFNIQEGYELVLEINENSKVRVHLPNGVKVLAMPQDFKSNGDEGVLISEAMLRGRVSFILSDLNGLQPSVFIDEKPLKLSYTRERLPLTLNSILQLPYEELGHDHLLPLSPRTGAYLRRIWDPNREELGINVANPEFEGMLREWGYLNDN